MSAQPAASERNEMIARMQAMENRLAGSAQPAEFTPSERNEMIARMQAMENRLAGMEATLSEVHAFNMRLAAVLDGLGGNPMFAAMMPPEVAAQMMEGN